MTFIGYKQTEKLKKTKPKIDKLIGILTMLGECGVWANQEDLQQG